jgi:hypothetical protein
MSSRSRRYPSQQSCNTRTQYRLAQVRATELYLERPVEQDNAATARPASARAGVITSLSATGLTFLAGHSSKQARS